jgi:hypothetical protein
LEELQEVQDEQFPIMSVPRSGDSSQVDTITWEYHIVLAVFKGGQWDGFGDVLHGDNAAEVWGDIEDECSAKFGGDIAIGYFIDKSGGGGVFEILYREFIIDIKINRNVMVYNFIIIQFAMNRFSKTTYPKYERQCHYLGSNLNRINN